MTTTTPEQFRAHFPGLTSTTHLASCSQGAISTEVIGALDEFRDSLIARGAPWDLWGEKSNEARAAFARMIHADPSEIAILPSASEGAFQIASTLDWSGSRNEIVTTDAEFPSIAHVWLAQRARGARVSHVALDPGKVGILEYGPQLSERTRLVSVPLFSYRNGYRSDVAATAREARDVGARVFIDAYQGAGVEPIDVRTLDCDYLVTGALKYMIGIPGVAFLYVRGGVREDAVPQLTGWFGRADPFSFDPRVLDFSGTATRFEVGTPAVASLYAAIAGMELLATVDPVALRDRVHALGATLAERLVLNGERLASPTDDEHRGPQVAIWDDQPNELTHFLESRKIVVSPRGRILRLALHYYSSADDIERVVSGIQEFRIAQAQ